MNPIPFSELLKQATRGPFFILKQENSCCDAVASAVIGRNGVIVCDNEPYYPQAVRAIDQELILRLLSFAEAGGMAALQGALDRLEAANARADRTGTEPGFRTDDIEQSIALLNGLSK